MVGTMAEGVQHPLARGDAAERLAVLVLGMHRSGTSAMTRVLSFAGLSLPKHMLGAQEGNDEGHWEPKTLLDLHEALLNELGSQWYDWRRLDFSLLAEERQNYYRREIKQRIADEFEDSAAFIIKEPRLCRFADLYISILRELQIRPAFVLPFRNPLAVMRSLGARDGHTRPFSALLWLRHVLDAEASTRQFPRAIVSYEHLLSDWRGTVRLVGARTGAFFSDAVDAAGIEASLSPRLQHHAPSQLELEGDDTIAEWVKQTYFAYRALEEDPNDKAALKTLDRIRAEFDLAGQAFGPAMYQELSVRERAFSQALEDAQNLHLDVLAKAHDEFEVRLQTMRREEAHNVANDYRRALSAQTSVILQLSDRNAEYAVALAGHRFELGSVEKELRLATAQLNVARQDMENASKQVTVARAAERKAAALSDEARRKLSVAIEELSQARALQRAGEEEHSRLSQQIDRTIARANQDIAVANSQIADRDRLLAERDQMLAERDQMIGGWRQVLTERDALVNELRCLLTQSEDALIEAQSKIPKSTDLSVPPLRADELELSVVVPCYNQGQFVADELALLAQEPGLSVEVIVVNDGSTEARTLRALDALRSRRGVSVIDQKNGGLSAARNAGLLAARGKFVLFLDADDVVTPGLKERVKQAEASGADVTIFDYVISNEYLTYFERPEPYTISAENLTTEGFEYRWERGLTVPIHAGIFHRHSIRALFHTEMAAKEDWVFWVTNFRAGMTAAYIPALQAIYRQSGSNMTKNVGRMMENWISAARTLGDRMDEDRTRFLEASMAHVRSYYVPVLQWHARHSTQARSRVERIAHRAWLYFESVGPRGIPQRVLKGAVRHGLRGVKQVLGRALQGVVQLKHVPAHITRRVNFAVRRSTPKPNVAFSIIVPVYNHAQHLSRCFSSLTDQKYRPFEIIAVDDCSPDPRVREVMGIYAKHNPEVFKAVHNERNLGISATLNRAAEAASGEWLVLVDCDDWLELNALSEIAKAIKGRDSIGYLFTDRRRIDEVGGKNRVETFGGRPDLISEPFPYALRMSMVASHLKVIRRDIHFALGGYNVAVDGVQDWDFALRAMNEGVQFSYIPKPVYNYRWHEASVSLSAAVSQWRLANVVRQRSMFGARLPLPPLEQVRGVLARHQCAIKKGGQFSPIEALSAVPEETSALLLRIGSVAHVRWVERLRCAGFSGAIAALVDAPYAAEFAGEFRQMSGFFDQLITSDPLWSVALSPVAPHDKHVVFDRGTTS